MATVTEPIALDKSINTTEAQSRNIADVLAEELARIAGVITTSESVEDILTDMATTKDTQIISGTAVFDTVDGNLVKTLKVAITPSQAGSGTPSPSNIRPISGYTEEVISVKDSTDTTQETYTIPFGQTVYGGTLDVLTGELTIDRGYTDMGSLAWFITQTGTFKAPVNDIKVATAAGLDSDLVCSIYANTTTDHNAGASQPDDSIWRYAGNTAHVVAKDSAYSDATAFKTAVTGQTLVYPLATPTTISLTPQTVKALVGENHIQASTGDVLQCKYSMIINGDDLAQLL